MSTDFVHLHLHTDYSMLDGACKAEALAEKAQELGMKAIAITDHGNMCGAFEFYTCMRKAGLHPIIGCEMYMAPGSRFTRTTDHPHHRGYHLVLLARDMEGYRNLCRLNAIAHLEGRYFKPRIDRESLEKHSQGLIGLSACLGGEVACLIREGNEAGAREAATWLETVLGKENFYIELQDHGMPEQKELNPKLIQLARDLGLPLVATNDAHYLNKAHAPSHEVLLCIGMQKKLEDKDRMSFSTSEFYFKSGDEMAALFPDVPEAISNTCRIAERCQVELETKNVNHYPVYNPPDNSDREDYIRQLCLNALPGRYGFDPSSTESLTAEQQTIMTRLDYELSVIQKMGFTSYFLVVWDFLDFARKQGIPIGPGRGSGAGSLVAYLLQITDIDPLRYNLLFERFLNPERVNPPDFDIDLCERRRSEVIEYVRQLYGEDCVAQIGTFGTLKAKAVIKDVSRVLGRSFDEGNTLTKMVPDDAKITLSKALEDSTDLANTLKDKKWVQEVFKHSVPLEGLNRNMSIHAAGVIIGDQPLTNLVPLGRGQNGEVITQYPAGPCEALGLLKMDFLGLRTLTIIQDACDLVEKNQGIKLDPRSFPLDDPATFNLLKRGDTVCVFQLESDGMQGLCRRFGVDRIEDIIALIALYRPGPMQFLDEFINRKHGKVAVEYDVPEMRPILEETYGIMLYQEEVMQVVQTVAGFSLGHADIVRRAMGKKKKEVMKAQFEDFKKGCAEKNINEKTAAAIWEKIETFAGYGFNKSHSAAYAFLAYRTAYLKANYPVEFMAANLSSEIGNAKRVSELIGECRRMGINVLPPDVSVSDLNFTVDKKNIRFGLAAIKGVGEAVGNAVIEQRGNAPFTNLQDFCEKVGSVATRRVMECLCQCGAFDCFNLRRSQIFEMIDDAIERAKITVEDRRTGQGNFLDMLEMSNGARASELIPPDIPEWKNSERLLWEKKLLGFYVTGHPLDDWQEYLKNYSVGQIAEVVKWPDNRGVRLGGMIATIAEKISKKSGNPWGVVTLEDADGTIDCMVYSDLYAEVLPILKENQAVFIEGTLSRRDAGGRPKVNATKIVTMEDAPRNFSQEVLIQLYEEQTSKEKLTQLRERLSEFPGETPLVLAVKCKSGHVAFVEAGPRWRILPGQPLRNAVDALMGQDSCHFKGQKTVPDRTPRAWEKGTAS